MVYKIILLRHGQSQFNSASLFCGWLDVPLSTRGELQAQQAGELLIKNNINPDILYTSKLRRTCQTGYIITKTLEKEYIDVKRSWKLNERHYGSLQGRDKSQVLQEVGEEKYMFWRRDYNGIPPLNIGENSGIDERYNDCENIPRGESLKMVVKRLEPYLKEEIFQDLIKGKIPLIIAHGSSCRSILKILKNINENDIKKLNIPNAIPLILELNENFELISETYLDEEEAKKRAEAVAKEGFTKK
ncbi:hypothetical protein WICMUC_004082 [Wickerhamomyces mucosus]|uniref:Phosphoglycerate mutase n=1 Tax=Wickerhamomyces mucosus TaxID=1378264 RepID=A0A9P8TBX5_9ASCO|nr:hypothetical protein WICMUC_004082 [Wickerhamomyces mucosus]